MRVVIQRVSSASVSVEETVVSSIKHGLLILLGVEEQDEPEDIDWLVKKISGLRIFNDDEGVMNKSIVDVRGEIIVVSQFTLHASTKKGNRPSYIRAAKPEISKPMYNTFVQKLKIATGVAVGEGVFGAMMKVKLVNDGPVTIMMDSKNKE